jgi:hypothetical protein
MTPRDTPPHCDRCDELGETIAAMYQEITLLRAEAERLRGALREIAWITRWDNHGGRTAVQAFMECGSVAARALRPEPEP